MDWNWLPAGEEGAAWDQGLELFGEAPYSLLYGWRRVYEEALGLKTYYLLAEDQGRVRGLCPLVLMRSPWFGGGKYLISLPYQTRAGLWAVDPGLRKGMLAAVGALAESLQGRNRGIAGIGGPPGPGAPGQSGARGNAAGPARRLGGF